MVFVEFYKVKSRDDYYEFKRFDEVDKSKISLIHSANIKSCCRTAWYPKTHKHTGTETGLEMKFGGNTPYFFKGTKWPRCSKCKEAQTFMFQIKHPERCIIQMFRCLSQDCYSDEYLIQYLDDPIKENQIIINETPQCIYDTYILDGWHKHKECEGTLLYLALKKIMDRNGFSEDITVFNINGYLCTSDDIYDVLANTEPDYKTWFKVGGFFEPSGNGLLWNENPLKHSSFLQIGQSEPFFPFLISGNYHKEHVDEMLNITVG